MPSTAPKSASMSVMSGVPANISGRAPATSATARMLRCPTTCTLCRSLMTVELPITPTTGFVMGCSPLVTAQIFDVLPHQELRTEIGDLGGAHLRQADVDLAAEDLQRHRSAGNAARRHAIERRPADEAELGAHTQCDQRVDTAADAAVEHHRHLVP